MKILIIGDVVGPCGVDFLSGNLYRIARENSVDMIIANGENAAKGNGLDKASADRLLLGGVDVITSGNHIWNKHEMQNIIDQYENILRPANYPSSCPGNGYVIYNAGGVKVLGSDDKADAAIREGLALTTMFIAEAISLLITFPGGTADPWLVSIERFAIRSRVSNALLACVVLTPPGCPVFHAFNKS